MQNQTEPKGQKMKDSMCLDIDELKGKVVQGAIQSYGDDLLLIAFTDGTAIQFYASSDTDDESQICANSFLTLGHYRLKEVKELFGDTRPDLVAKASNDRDYAEKIRLEAERAEYMRLKEQFEPQQPASTETPIA